METVGTENNTCSLPQEVCNQGKKVNHGENMDIEQDDSVEHSGVGEMIHQEQVVKDVKGTFVHAPPIYRYYSLNEVHVKNLQKRRKADSTPDVSVGTIDPMSTTFSCGMCKQGFKGLMDLNQHMLVSHAAETPYKCMQCSKVFLTERLLQRHKPVHGLFICHLCPKRYSRESILRNHIACKHTLVNQCYRCLKTFPSKTTLDRHVEAHGPVKACSCSTCVKRFDKKGNLKCDVSCRCQECNKKKKRIIKRRIYKCSDCNNVYSTSQGLYSHRRLHAGKLDKCAVCGKTYHIQSQYRIHLLTHTEQNFECSVCEKKFKQEYYLKRHMVVHSTEKKFECQYCDLAFRRNHELTCHVRIHTGEKNYLCKICGKSFATNTDMRKHERQHDLDAETKDSELDHKCGECGRSFTKKVSLLRHIMYHKMEKDVFCDLCGAGFQVKTSLTRHMKRNHNVGRNK